MSPPPGARRTWLAALAASLLVGVAVVLAQAPRRAAHDAPRTEGPEAPLAASAPSAPATHERAPAPERVVHGARERVRGDFVRRAVSIANPEGLTAFHASLRALERGERTRVRVMHYGDSNVAADLWSKVVRDALVARFGDGGPGYVVPSPWGSRTDPRLRFHGGEAWAPRRLGFARDFGPRDGLWGLAGVGVAASAGAHLRLTFEATGVPGTLELDALARPHGGALRITRGDDAVTLSLEAAQPGLARRRFALDGSAGEVRIRVARGEARLLGARMELDRPGIVYDVLGINGHRASAWGVWRAELLAAQLEGRAVDLVVLSYGANEALDAGLSFARYERALRDSIARAKALAPGASILLVGPVAMCPGNDRNAAISAIQRRVAAEVGAAFFETMAVSGGPGSLCPWTRARPSLVARDGLHLSRHGYQILGEELAAALLAGVPTGG